MKTTLLPQLSPIAKRLTALSIVTLLALNTTACQRFKKNEVINPPMPLVNIENQQNILTPVFDQNIGGKSKGIKSKKQSLTQSTTAFQTTVDSLGYLTASPNGKVVATDLNGAKLWEVSLKQGLNAGISIDFNQEQASHAIVSDKQGNIIALDRATGKILWQTKLSSNVLSPALVFGNRVVVLTNNGIANGISLQSGEVIWQFNTQSPSLSVRGSASPILLDAKTVLLATADGRIHAVNLDNGTPLWSRRAAISTGANEVDRLMDIDATPVFVDNILYITTYSGQLVAIDMTNRQVIFVKEIASLKSVFVDNTNVYVTTLDGLVVAYNRFTGLEAWSSDSLKYRGLSNPVSFHNTLIVGDKLGYLHILDTRTGMIIGRHQANHNVNKLSLQMIGSTIRVIAQSANGDFSIWKLGRAK